VSDKLSDIRFYVNRFRSFGVLTPPILPFSIGLAGRPYNSVGLSITVLHCDLNDPLRSQPLDRVKMNHRDKYLHQRSFSSKVVARTPAQTHTANPLHNLDHKMVITMPGRRTIIGLNNTAAHGRTMAIRNTSFTRNESE